jgi:hypothetical protein
MPHLGAVGLHGRFVNSSSQSDCAGRLLLQSPIQAWQEAPGRKFGRIHGPLAAGSVRSRVARPSLGRGMRECAHVGARYFHLQFILLQKEVPS